MSKKTTLQDLADIAGVSIATISRALNNSPSVNEQTKREIWRLAREQGYGFRPNMPTAIDQSSATISIIVPTPQGRAGWLMDPFFQQLLGAVGQAAQDQDSDVLISHFVPQNYKDLSEIIDKNRTDGLVFLGQSFLHDRLNRLVDHDPRFVVWGAELPGQRYCSIGSDNERGGRRATSHLVRLGRRKILFLGDISGPEIRQRFEGYKQALEADGVAFDEDRVITANFEVESAEAMIDACLSRNLEFDGIVAGSDILALGALRCLIRRGIDVPGEVSIIGYDDVKFARYSRPALSTVRQDLELAGRLIVSKILGAGQGQVMQSERLPTDVIIRESCGA